MDFNINGDFRGIIFRLSILRKSKYHVHKAVIPAKFIILQTWNS